MGGHRQGRTRPLGCERTGAEVGERDGRARLRPRLQGVVGLVDDVPQQRRPSAYGAFTAGFGVAWFAGSAAMGALYDVSLRGVVGFSIAAELAAIPFFIAVARRISAQRTFTTK